MLYKKDKMNQIDINKKFVEALESKIPKKTDLANFISDTLFIEKETAYRRLRNEVQFSLREAIMIACKLNISIEEIIPTENIQALGRNSMRLAINQIDKEQNCLYIDSTINFLKKIVNEPYSEYALTLTQITFSLFYQYSYLLRFYMLKHAYHTNRVNERKTFDQIQEVKEITQVRKELYTLYRQITYTYHIWDIKIMTNLINDILYFKSIHLISEEDVRNLKEELHLFFSNLDQLTTDGFYKETGNKFDFYISKITIDHTYAYLYSDHHLVSMSTSFTNHEIISYDEITFQNIRNWIKPLIHSSVLISGSAEKERIEFFHQQHQIVDQL